MTREKKNDDYDDDDNEKSKKKHTSPFCTVQLNTTHDTVYAFGLFEMLPCHRCFTVDVPQSFVTELTIHTLTHAHHSTYTWRTPSGCLFLI